MLQLDKKTVSEFEESWVERLKVFFIDAGCSGTKIDMTSDFEINSEIDKLHGEYWFELYAPKTDREYLENARITRVIVADHTWVAKVRYIFASDEVEDRCWCWTSFAFEKPIPVIDLEKLRLLRQNFKNKNI